MKTYSFNIDVNHYVKVKADDVDKAFEIAREAVMLYLEGRQLNGKVTVEAGEIHGGEDEVERQR